MFPRGKPTVLSLIRNEQTGANMARSRSKLGHVRIGTVLPAIITALALLGLASAGFIAYQAIIKRQESEAFLKVNRAARCCCVAQGSGRLNAG